MTHYPRTALVVEDDPATRKLLSIVLEREGLAVVALEAVPEAFKWLEDHCPTLAILDVNLPGGTGFEIVQLIDDLYGSTSVAPVVFVVSGLRQEHNILHGLRLGVAEYLTKPFSPLELIARVRRHLPDPEEMSHLASALDINPEALTAPNAAEDDLTSLEPESDPASDLESRSELEPDLKPELELVLRKPA
jgi:DNA-binding response OmpR family regulator